MRPATFRDLTEASSGFSLGVHKGAMQYEVFIVSWRATQDMRESNTA